MVRRRKFFFIFTYKVEVTDYLMVVKVYSTSDYAAD